LPHTPLFFSLYPYLFSFLFPFTFVPNFPLIYHKSSAARLSRAAIEKAFEETGFQLWRMKS